jgi:hypothetical protein
MECGLDDSAEKAVDPRFLWWALQDLNLRLPPCEDIAIKKTKDIAEVRRPTKARSGILGNSYWTLTWTRIQTSENEPMRVLLASDVMRCMVQELTTSPQR